MIKLQKLPEPQILIDNGAEWTRQHLENIANGVESTSYLKSRYNQKSIKDQIVKETAGKCAYCESQLRHIHHGDIEHIFPKSLDESKRFEWNNLTLACEICNQNKSNTPIESLVDPYTMDPSDHFYFAGSIILETSDNGLNAKVILDLNRPALIERRQLELEKIASPLRNILKKSIPIETRNILLESLINKFCSKSSEYSAMFTSELIKIKQLMT